MDGLFIKPGLVIPGGELQERFIQSSGPGGQNVNKVASAVQLSFDVLRSACLPDRVRERLLRLADARLSKEFVLTITARRFREQDRNRADARERLADIIRKAATPPTPRRATRIPKSSKRERLDSKKRNAATKQNRARPRAD